jgi:hypothetical protein
VSRESRERKKAFARWMWVGWNRKLRAMEAAGCDPLDVDDVRERAKQAAMNERLANRVVLRGGL